LSIVASILFLKKELATGPQEVLNYDTLKSDIISIDAPNNYAPVKNYVEACLYQELSDTVFATAVQGGYFGTPNDFLRYDIIYNQDYLYVPYYLDQGREELINKTRMEEEISFGLSVSLDKCTNLSFFPYSVNAVLSEAKVETKISENTVIVKVTLPIIIQEAGSYKEIRQFDLILPSNLYKLHSAASEITSIQMNKENVVCISCLNEIMNKYKIELNTIQTEDEQNYIILYSLSDLEKQVSFNFAHKFNTTRDYGNNFVRPIENMNASVGEIFTYKIRSYQKGLTFSDNSDLFEVDEIGTISFTPVADNIGTHIILLSITDQNNVTQEEVFTISIQGEQEWEIEPIGTIYAKIGAETNYSVRVIPEIEAKYSINNDILTINSETGVMTINPTIEQKGDYELIVSVTDEQGVTNNEIITLIITE
ncbi:MAG: hypothetical protein AABX04_01345, partial [Nanoarchaeota archaeon]